jgi:hypothetical protein
MPAVAAIDAVTAHLGALGGIGGAITVLGTGAIAIAHPGPDETGMWSPDWSRADGWGHLFGDRGGGAWLGRHGLELGLRTHDGLDEHGRALLEAATSRFGPPASWPGQFYTRGDRAGLLAEFAADIADCARSDDTASAELLRQAGEEAARSAVAAARGPVPMMRRRFAPRREATRTGRADRRRRRYDGAHRTHRGSDGRREPPRRRIPHRNRPPAPARHHRRARRRAARWGTHARPPRRGWEGSAHRIGSSGSDDLG